MRNGLVPPPDLRLLAPTRAARGAERNDPPGEDTDLLTPGSPPAWILGLPAINAALNATSAALLLLGYLAIRRRRRDVHQRLMLAAVACSTLFLLSYLVYHYNVGSVPFRKTGPIRAAYFTILLTHTVLAATIVPLVLVTLKRALGQRFDAHRDIARRTLPLWAYVSVTGVLIYWMLYRL